MLLDNACRQQIFWWSLPIGNINFAEWYWSTTFILLNTTFRQYLICRKVLDDRINYAEHIWTTTFNEVKSMNQSNYLLCFVRIQVCFYLELYEIRFISTLFCMIQGWFQPIFLRFDNESNLNCRNWGLFVAEMTSASYLSSLFCSIHFCPIPENE